jgi:predicted dehydrogenase
MVKPLRAGVIGAGNWGAEAHIPGFQACEGVSVVAVADADGARAASVAAGLGVPASYDSAEAMLAAETLDLVSIVTPDSAHAWQAKAAMAAGLAVLCEKPLAKTSAEAHALAGIARQSGAITKVGFTMRFTPTVMRLRELIEDGFIGKPYLFQCFIQNGQFLDPQKPRHWKMMKEHAGAGAIVEYGIHALDLARYLMGEVTRVSATGRTLVPERPAPDGKGTVAIDVDDSAVWLMEFGNGGIGSGHAGWATVGRAPGLDIRIYGANGAARVTLSDDLPGNEELRIATAAEQVFRPVEIPERLATQLPITEPWYRRFHQNLIRHFVADVRAGRAASPTFEDGARAQLILEAVVAAMDEGRWVDVG